MLDGGWASTMPCWAFFHRLVLVGLLAGCSMSNAIASGSKSWAGRSLLCNRDGNVYYAKDGKGVKLAMDGEFRLARDHRRLAI